jgi:hypothetical protein
MTHRYRGCDFHAGEIERIRRLIDEEPSRCRAELSRLTCRELNWLKPDGGLKQMSARVAMLQMHDDGLIVLPPPRCKQPVQRVHISSRTDPGDPLDQPAHALTPRVLHRVDQKAESRLWNE